MTKTELEYCNSCDEEFAKADMYKTQDPWGWAKPFWRCEDCEEAAFDAYHEGMIG